VFRFVDHWATDDKFLLKVVDGKLTVEHFTGSKWTQGAGTRRVLPAEEGTSLPMVPLVVGVAACFGACCLLASLLWVCRTRIMRRHVCERETEDIENPADACNLSDATPRLLGQCSRSLSKVQSADKSKTKACCDSEASDLPRVNSHEDLAEPQRSMSGAVRAECAVLELSGIRFDFCEGDVAENASEVTEPVEEPPLAELLPVHPSVAQVSFLELEPSPGSIYGIESCPAPYQMAHQENARQCCAIGKKHYCDTVSSI
jgi:hypothetical protein